MKNKSDRELFIKKIHLLNFEQAFEEIRKEKLIDHINFLDLCGVSEQRYMEILASKDVSIFDTLLHICDNINVPMSLFILLATDVELLKPEMRKLVELCRPDFKDIYFHGIQSDHLSGDSYNRDIHDALSDLDIERSKP